MVAQFDIPSILTFLVAVVVLSVFSYLDFRERQVSNRVVLVGGLVGLIVIAAGGSLSAQISLQILALIIVAPLSYVLWRLGAIGGADLKSLLVLSVLSPGLQFAAWSDVLLEVVLGDCLRILLMLALGLLWGRYVGSESDSHSEQKTTPLIPLLLLAYVLSQLLAFV